ncbi:MAG TPA: ROK family protein [Rhizomicrobium sp.]|jgi:polyphosphate glucokinase|nr:ROK family protein [Rhizomicrobium sp.]
MARPIDDGTRSEELRILAIDIGGTGLKASIVDAAGGLIAPRRRIKTPYPCPPSVMMDALARLIAPLPAHHRIAIGFPGVVRGGAVVTAPHFETKDWTGFPLAKAAAERFGSPARLVNDAEMQGLAVIRGKGLEFVLTLGTGAGTGLFRDGQLMPHLELAQHPVYGKKKTYNDYIGDAALKKEGAKHWNKRVAHTIEILTSLLNFDHLFIGGGNARKLTLDASPSITIVSNDAGLEGGAALWRGNPLEPGEDA